MEMNRSRKGDFAEFYAVTWLWDNGYEVFLNAGCTGPIDLVAFKDGEVKLVDVKTTLKDYREGYPHRIGTSRTSLQKKLGVVFLSFNPTSRKLYWVNHHEQNDKQLGLDLA